MLKNLPGIFALGIFICCFVPEGVGKYIMIGVGVVFVIMIVLAVLGIMTDNRSEWERFRDS